MISISNSKSLSQPPGIKPKIIPHSQGSSSKLPLPPDHNVQSKSFPLSQGQSKSFPHLQFLNEVQDLDKPRFSFLPDGADIMTTPKKWLITDSRVVNAPYQPYSSFFLNDEPPNEARTSPTLLENQTESLLLLEMSGQRESNIDMITDTSVLQKLVTGEPVVVKRVGSTLFSTGKETQSIVTKDSGAITLYDNETVDNALESRLYTHTAQATSGYSSKSLKHSRLYRRIGTWQIETMKLIIGSNEIVWDYEEAKAEGETRYVLKLMNYNEKHDGVFIKYVVAAFFSGATHLVVCTHDKGVILDYQVYCLEHYQQRIAVIGHAIQRKIANIFSQTVTGGVYVVDATSIKPVETVPIEAVTTDDVLPPSSNMELIRRVQLDTFVFGQRKLHCGAMALLCFEYARLTFNNNTSLFELDTEHTITLSTLAKFITRLHMIPGETLSEMLVLLQSSVSGFSFNCRMSSALSILTVYSQLCLLNLNQALLLGMYFMPSIADTEFENSQLRTVTANSVGKNLKFFEKILDLIDVLDLTHKLPHSYCLRLNRNVYDENALIDMTNTQQVMCDVHPEDQQTLLLYLNLPSLRYFQFLFFALNSLYVLLSIDTMIANMNFHVDLLDSLCTRTEYLIRFLPISQSNSFEKEIFVVFGSILLPLYNQILFVKYLIEKNIKDRLAFILVWLLKDSYRVYINAKKTKRRTNIMEELLLQTDANYESVTFDPYDFIDNARVLGFEDNVNDLPMSVQEGLDSNVDYLSRIEATNVFAMKIVTPNSNSILQLLEQHFGFLDPALTIYKVVVPFFIPFFKDKETKRITICDIIQLNVQFLRALHYKEEGRATKSLELFQSSLTMAKRLELWNEIAIFSVFMSQTALHSARNGGNLDLFERAHTLSQTSIDYYKIWKSKFFMKLSKIPIRRIYENLEKLIYVHASESSLTYALITEMHMDDESVVLDHIREAVKHAEYANDDIATGVAHFQLAKHTKNLTIADRHYLLAINKLVTSPPDIINIIKSRVELKIQLRSTLLQVIEVLQPILEIDAEIYDTHEQIVKEMSLLMHHVFKITIRSNMFSIPLLKSQYLRFVKGKFKTVRGIQSFVRDMLDSFAVD
ncbi:hypothetical protein PCE1_003662 [Barthelona sp. PCE]